MNAVWHGAMLAVLMLASQTSIACREEHRMTAEQSPADAAEPRFRNDGELVVMSTDHRVKARFEIEIAETAGEVELGLMGRSTMDDDQGMLFLFPEEEYRSFWMKNTVLPLDMIFINADMEIVTIHEETVPFSERSYPSTRPARYVLEVKAGTAGQHGIAAGDRVFWQRIKR